MVWDDQEIFKDVINLVLFQIESYRNNRNEKDRIINFFKKFIESFFEQAVEKTCEFDTFTALDVSHLLSENFVKWRLAMPDSPLEEVIGSMKPDHYQDEEEKVPTSEQRKTKTGRNRNQRILSHITGYTGECSRNPNLIFTDELFFEKSISTLDSAFFIPLKTEGRNVLFAPQYFYGLIFYLFCLYGRLCRARSMIQQTILKDFYIEPQSALSFINEFYNQIFLKAVRTHITGIIEIPKYEEFCRHYLGQQAYLLFSIESLTSSVLFNVLGIVSKNTAATLSSR